MFTGLIERVAPIQSVGTTGFGKRLGIALGPLAADAKEGDSICVNGVCLTISRLAGDLAEFEVMAETLRVCTLGERKVNEAVNLERALALGDRLGGHLVQGHVDGIGTISRIDKTGGNWTIWAAAEERILKQMIPKGSVAMDGVSLTVVDVRQERFSVSLIPTTLQKTNLGQCQEGDRVNLETDLVGKWINRRLDKVLGDGKKGAGVTLEKLRELGF
ncbi:MAG: Riboflavin synthase [Planctomycetes bacterium ADurb.Bin412]|nr:MAG: Riboflavin synthase [Planctomycetes bacterium ADurb.Bin412]